MIACALAMIVHPLAAQGDVSAAADVSSPNPQPTLTLDQVTARQAAMEADADIQVAVKDELRAKYQQAMEALKQSAENLTQAASYRNAMTTAPTATEEARRQLAALSEAAATPASIPAGDIADIQKVLDIRKAEFSELKDELAGAQRDLALLAGRPVVISARFPAARLALGEVSAKLQAADDSSGDSTPAQLAEQTLLVARQQLLESELALLNQEQLSQLVRENLLQAQVDLLARKVEISGAALESLSGWVNQRLASEAKQVSFQADVAPGEIPTTDGPARDLAEEVRQLAKEFEGVVADLGAVTALHDGITSRLDDLSSEFDSIQNQLKVSHGGVAMAQILFALRSRLPARGTIDADLKARQKELEEASLAGFKVNEKLRSHPAVEEKFVGHPSTAVAGLVATRSEILTKLKRQYGTLIRAQASLVGDERQYANKVQEVRTFLEEQLFWRRSSPPVSLKTFAATPAGLRWLTSGAHWLEFWNVMKNRFQRSPLISWTWFILFAVLVVVRPRLAAAIERTGSKIRHVSSDRYHYTMEALLWTCLLAVPAPLFFGFIEWTISQATDSSSWLRGIARGVRVSIWFTWGAGFLAAVCRKDGLGVAHFGWSQEPLVLLRRSVLLATLVFVPALLIASGSLYGASMNYLDNAGRMCFIVAHLWVALLLWRLLRFSDGGFSEFIREEPAHLLVRTRYIWSALVLGIPLFIVAISCLGYFLTGIELSMGFLGALAVLIFGSVVYWVVLRWFMMKERKLALAEALERRRARLEAAESDEQDTESGDMLSLDAVDEKLVLRSISEQTRHLLQFLFGVAIAVAIATLWARFLPIFAALGVVTVAGGLTLLDLSKALMILIVTVTAARNLPGLLELAVLRTTAMESGARNSVSTLFQYAVIAIGLTSFFGVLHVDWAKLGWIAAALSVGLGFGLQEVVSNFVCGLILLFEQPIRVGDVVTVDGVDGKVSRIRMRATTIINWDRQELVVPNKNIITGTLLNWTLSNPISRVIVTVGVAYGSDTDRSMRIMEQAAIDSDYVIDDPAPLATFEDFADSCLTLKLRAYLPNIDNRVQAVSELHSEIDRRFKEAGIEISFPQRDLHLRSAGDWVSRVGMPPARKAGDSGDSGQS